MNGRQYGPLGNGITHFIENYVLQIQPKPKKTNPTAGAAESPRPDAGQNPKGTARLSVYERMRRKKIGDIEFLKQSYHSMQKWMQTIRSNGLFAVGNAQGVDHSRVQFLKEKLSNERNVGFGEL